MRIELTIIRQDGNETNFGGFTSPNEAIEFACKGTQFGRRYRVETVEGSLGRRARKVVGAN